MLRRRGLYVYQLEWWLQHFPAEQLMVVNYHEVRVLGLEAERKLSTVRG